MDVSRLLHAFPHLHNLGASLGECERSSVDAPRDATFSTRETGRVAHRGVAAIDSRLNLILGDYAWFELSAARKASRIRWNSPGE